MHDGKGSGREEFSEISNDGQLLRFLIFSLSQGTATPKTTQAFHEPRRTCLHKEVFSVQGAEKSELLRFIINMSNADFSSNSGSKSSFRTCVSNPLLKSIS